MATTGAYPIVNFHGIGAPLRPLEPGETDYWLGRERFQTILDLIADHPNRENIQITFDDGNTSDLLIAAPELKNRGLSAEFFVLTGRIGQHGSLDIDDIRTLLGMGMRIGSHGVDHQDWTKLPASILAYELETSRERLTEICEADIRTASLPFGWYNNSVLLELKRCGYTTAYSSSGGNARVADFLKPRTSVRADTTDITVNSVLAGQTPIWRSLRSQVRARFRV
ncbi:polysaccharide deacetylase family protein [Rhizobium cauense]|uniref:polysaccharide deacetylase family protein n=1 Tax=Rhizobium cauense TaxID=1166683 RepID=UPI001C6EC5B4|nr:polysaccharide deacetylase family protein [Rhizobium cauense]MBW9113736.1 polysaccharide deacetylase family protein [Rhizobium cauense]